MERGMMREHKQHGERHRQRERMSSMERAVYISACRERIARMDRVGHTGMLRDRLAFREKMSGMERGRHGGTQKDRPAPEKCSPS